MQQQPFSRRNLLRIAGLGIAGLAGCLFTDNDDDQPEQRTTTRRSTTQTTTPAPSPTTATTRDPNTEKPTTEEPTQEQVTDAETTSELTDADRGSVVLTFDDGLNSVYEQAFPIMKEYGFPGLSAVVCDRIEVEGPHPDELTTGELTEMQDAGWEIGGHSYANHPDFTELSTSELHWQYERQSEWLNKHGLLTDISSIVYPYNSVNQRVVDSCQEYFDIGFGGYTRPKDGIENALSVGRVKGHQLDTAKKAIAAAAKNGHPTVLMYHGVTHSVQEENDISIDDFRETMAYIDSFGSALKVSTPSELYRLIN